MKTITKIIVFLFLIFNVTLCFAEAIKTDSKISEVTVYPDSALITRLANLKLAAGEYQIVFPDIIPDVDENSLRVSVGDIQDVKILGAQVKKEFLEEAAAAKVKEIQEKIQARKMRKENSRIAKISFLKKSSFWILFDYFLVTKSPKI